MKAIYIFFVAIVLSSCAFKIHVPKGDMPLNPKAYYSGGAAAVDITPPPGYSLGGFGNELSKIARGWWTRLYAKAFYYEDPSGNPLVIVSADLWSVSQGLCDKVLADLHRYGDKYKLPREWVIITATHTHHSPGNFSSSMGYNLGSSALMGFDKDLFEFLARRMAYAIKLAIDQAEPVDIYYTFSSLEGQTRNRSLGAFYFNPQEEQDKILNKIDFKAEFLNESSFCYTQDTNVFKAVDPTLTSVIVKKKDSDEISSVLSVFGVHPTVMGPKNALISSDIFGVSSLSVANYISTHSDDSVVVAYLNGQNGDVSANWFRQDKENTERIGYAISSATLGNVYSPQLIKITTGISCKLDFKEIKNAVIHGSYDELNCGGEILHRTALVPSMGKPSKKGAEDGRTEAICMEDECFYKEGNPKSKCSDPQGVKKEMAITKLISGSAPNLLPVGLYKLGPLKMVTLPGETTTALGERLKGSAAEESDDHVVLLSLANEYASYFTTPSEYNAQHYEGASTIYGPATAMFFKEFIERVKMAKPRTDGYYNKKKYNPGIKLDRKLIEKKWLDFPWNFEDDLTQVYSSVNPTKLARFFSFEWNYKIELEKALDVKENDACIAEIKIICKQDSGEWKDLLLSEDRMTYGSYLELQSDHTSSNFISYIKTTEQLRLVWESIWLIPETYQSDQLHKMLIKTKDGKILESTEFTISKN